MLEGEPEPQPEPDDEAWMREQVEAARARYAERAARGGIFQNGRRFEWGDPVNQTFREV